MLQAHTPGIMEDLLKDLKQSGRNQGSLFWRHILQGIEADRMVGIEYVEIDQIISPSRRELSYDSLSEVAVRIEERQSLTAADVMFDEDPEERRLADARLTNEVHVVTTIPPADAESSFAAIVRLGEACDLVI